MASPVSVKDIFSKEFKSVEENDTLSKCLEAFEKGTLPVLAVLSSSGKYEGMITKRAILRSRLDPTTAKVKTLMRAGPTANFDCSLGKLLN